MPLHLYYSPQGFIEDELVPVYVGQTPQFFIKISGKPITTISTIIYLFFILQFECFSVICFHWVHGPLTCLHDGLNNFSKHWTSQAQSTWLTFNH
jgi:hypothetical protein